ncbi:MAG TPA: hypothetical protein VGB50_11985 [Flavobacterium sp.]
MAAAFYFIWNRLANDETLNPEMLRRRLDESFSAGSIAALLLLSFVNRFLEILKWQNLVSSFKMISVPESSKQVLAALTVSIFTPNGIGEYGAKALFFEKAQARKIVFLNLVCNGIQMLLTIVFGIFGLLYFNSVYEILTPLTILYLFGGFCIVTAILSLMKKISIKGYSIDKVVKKVNSIPQKIHRRNTVLAICRYLVFSHQYYLLFVILGVTLPYPLLMSIICSVYFLASALPTFQFLDFAVKGGVAVYFFGLAGVDEWIPIFVTTMMWLLNVVLPVVLGSYYVIRFKPKWKQ